MGVIREDLGALTRVRARQFWKCSSLKFYTQCLNECGDMCKCYWTVSYTVHVTAFCLGGPFFSRHGVHITQESKQWRIQQNKSTLVQLPLTTQPGNEVGLFYFASEPTWTNSWNILQAYRQEAKMDGWMVRV